MNNPLWTDGSSRPPTTGHNRRRATIGLYAVFSALILLTAVLIEPCAAGAGRVVYETAGSSPGAPFSNPLGIFFDKTRGECYVADTGNHQIVVYDDQGMPLYRFYHTIDAGVAGEPKSVAVDSKGHIFVTDNAVDYIDVLDFKGRSIARISPPEDNCPEPHRFDIVALGPGDQIYASISCADRRIAVIDDAFEISRVVLLKSPSKYDNRFCITGLDVDDAGRIHITDVCAPEAMVQVYDADGNFVSGFGQHDAGFENFSHPAGISVLPNGDMWIVDTIRQVASRFTPDGEFLMFVGGKGEGLGSLSYPSWLTTDGEGRLYVLERGGNRYQCFQFDEADVR